MEEERKDVLFRKSAFGGFKRKDVIAYIEQLQNELAQSKSECLKQMKLLEDYKRNNKAVIESCMDSAKSAVDEVDRMLVSMSEQLKNANAEKAELEKQIQLLRSEQNEKIVQTVNDTDTQKKIAELTAQIEDLRARLAVETVANEILSDRSAIDLDDGFNVAVEEVEESEMTEEKENEITAEIAHAEPSEESEGEVTVEEIEQIINRFLN
ncbi:MAG: hypothetical protein IJB86_04785 [Clostridia bacterium]|nr:hypothetical protein [Clostridia bacterium]